MPMRSCVRASSSGANQSRSSCSRAARQACASPYCAAARSRSSTIRLTPVRRRRAAGRPRARGSWRAARRAARASPGGEGVTGPDGAECRGHGFAMLPPPQSQTLLIVGSPAASRASLTAWPCSSIWISLRRARQAGASRRAAASHRCFCRRLAPGRGFQRRRALHPQIPAVRPQRIEHQAVAGKMRVEAIGEALGFLLRYRKYAAAGEHEAPPSSLRCTGSARSRGVCPARRRRRAGNRARPAVPLLVHLEALAQPGFGRFAISEPLPARRAAPWPAAVPAPEARVRDRYRGNRARARTDREAADGNACQSLSPTHAYKPGVSVSE